MVSTRKGPPITGDAAFEAVGLRMSTAQVQRMNELREASRVRALSSAEENELFKLEQINRTRARVF